VTQRCAGLPGARPGNPADHVLIMDSDGVFLTDMVVIDRRGRSSLPFGYPLEPRTGTRDHWLPERHHALEVAAGTASQSMPP
jgi:hypothetical protein